MLNQLITSKTRLRLLIKFFISQANRGYLNGLANEFNESTNSIRKELNHLSEAGYLEKYKDPIIQILLVAAVISLIMACVENESIKIDVTEHRMDELKEDLLLNRKLMLYIIRKNKNENTEP